MLNHGPFKSFLLISYIGNNENPPITNEIGWSLDVRYCGVSLYNKQRYNIARIASKSICIMPNREQESFLLQCILIHCSVLPSLCSAIRHPALRIKNPIRQNLIFPSFPPPSPPPNPHSLSHHHTKSSSFWQHRGVIRRDGGVILELLLVHA